MDRQFLQVLIDGQIGRRMFEDDEFKFHVELKQTPQIYLNTFSRSEFWAVKSSQALHATKRKWAGWGVVPAELEAALDLMGRYADISKQDQNALKEAEGVDSVMVMKPGQAQSKHARKVGRKYLLSAQSVTFLKEWVDKVRKQVLLIAKQKMGPEQLKA